MGNQCVGKLIGTTYSNGIERGKYRSEARAIGTPSSRAYSRRVHGAQVPSLQDEMLFAVAAAVEGLLRVLPWHETHDSVSEANPRHSQVQNVWLS